MAKRKRKNPGRPKAPGKKAAITPVPAASEPPPGTPRHPDLKEIGMVLAGVGGLVVTSAVYYGVGLIIVGCACIVVAYRFPG